MRGAIALCRALLRSINAAAMASASVQGPAPQPREEDDMRNLQGTVAWVTGAGTGIGQAGAIALAKAGSQVVISGRRAEALADTEAAIKEAGGTAVVEPLDVSDKAAVNVVAKKIEERWNRCDILVSSAGINVLNRHWENVDSEDFDRVIAINLNGAFYCAQAVLPMMRERQDGLIINVSSWAGRYNSFLTGPAYGASKFGMCAMSENLNIEECFNGIRACALCPGEVATPILDNRPVPVTADDKAKMVQSEDMGDLILFIAQTPQHVCLNEIVVSPTWNRGYVKMRGGGAG